MKRMRSERSSFTAETRTESSTVDSPILAGSGSYSLTSRSLENAFRTSDFLCLGLSSFMSRSVASSPAVSPSSTLSSLPNHPPLVG